MDFKYDKENEKLIVQEAKPLEYEQLKIWLNRFVKNYKFTPAFKRGVWNGKIDFFNKGSINMGLWKECFIGLNEIGAKFNILNKEDFPINRKVTVESVENFCKEFFKNHKIKDKKIGEYKNFMPYDYQIETAYKILKNKFCLAEVATSGGKSLILSIVFFYILKNINPEAKILLIVPSLLLVNQFYDNIMEYNLGFQDVEEEPQNKNPLELRLEEIMSDKPRKYEGVKDANIYIATYQSLSKVENWGDSFFSQFHTVAVDESHQSKAKSLVKILEKTFSHANYRFGVSGTFPKGFNAENLTIQSVLGPIVNSIKAKKLQEEGKISKVKIKQILLNHQDPEFEDRIKAVRKIRNQGARAYLLEGEYIRNSVKRMDFIMKLVKKCKSNTLMLFNIIEYGEKLREELKKQFNEQDNIEILYIDGNVPKKKRDEIKTLMELKDGVIRILVATYGTLSTGVSINNIHNIIFCESFKSEIRIIQSIGRGLRLHKDKDKAIIFDLVDCYVESGQSNTFYKHGIERRKMYKEHSYPYDNMKFVL